MNKPLPKHITATSSTITESPALELTVIKKERQYLFRGTKRKRNSEHLVGKQLSLALLHKLSFVNDFQEGLNKISYHFEGVNEPCIISFINAHCFNLCHDDRGFSSAIVNSDIVFRDGKGMEILCKSMNIEPGVNMCGTDFIPVILERFKDNSLALLGTNDEYVSKAAEVLRQKGNKVVLFQNGFLSDEQYLDSLQELQPKVILLAMGMPRQELFSKLLKEKLNYGCLIINGGAVIDHIGGKVSRAPLWMRKRGLEWLFRLMQEPRRLFNRYVIGNILFLHKVFQASGRVQL